jgi:hypothetical protein
MSSASLQGSLDSFKLPDVLTFLNTTRKTGMLTLTRGEKEAYVFFRAGALVYAASNQEPFRGRLAAIVSKKTSDDTAKIEVSEVIYEAFTWTTATFAFYDDIELPAKAVTISIDLSNLIMEGARRISEWQECLRLLPDSSAVFRVAANPESEKVTLSRDEWRILFLINGQRSLEDVCRESETDAFRVYRVVIGLLANKLIQSAMLQNLDETADATVRQSAADFGGDSTVRETPDDTSLLVADDATLAFKDVVRKTVAQLLITGGEDEGTVIPLVENEYRIGRQRDNQIVLHDLGVSARHARIFRGPDGFAIEDLKSRNGTWVNSARITQSILQSGDEIRLGATDLRFETLFEAPVSLRR